jgi:hypothetical protein
LRPALASALLGAMSVQRQRPRDLQWQLFHRSDATAGGLLTADQLRGTAWNRLRYGVYADSRLEYDHELACRAVALRLPTAVLAGPSAAYLYGVRHAAGQDDEVHVIVEPGEYTGSRKGVRIHRTELDDGEAIRRGDILRTAPARTAWDLAAWVDPARAVSVIDGLLGLGVLDLATFADLVERRRGRRGWRRAARALDLADGRAQSPPESQLRVRLVLAGLPTPIPQYPVRLPSGLLLHPDLAWPEFKVAAEYDGQWHADAEQLHLDRQRLNQLVSAGWIVLHVTGRRLGRDFRGIQREIRDALLSRGWRPRG